MKIGIERLLRFAFGALVAGMTVFCGAFAWYAMTDIQPASLPLQFDLKAGSGLRAAASQMQRAGVLTHPERFVAMARLLGEPEFTMLFHQGIKESIHVAAVDEDAILLATFDSRTTVGMVRLFAKEAGAAIGAILAEARERSARVGALEGPRGPMTAAPRFARGLPRSLSGPSG